MPVSKEKEQELWKRMENLGIENDDLEEKFLIGSGKGGQKLNKTASCVHLKHIPTGLRVKCQKDRSRAINRFLARRQLCDLYEEKILGKKSLKETAKEKIRKQKKRRKRRQSDQV